MVTATGIVLTNPNAQTPAPLTRRCLLCPEHIHVPAGVKPWDPVVPVCAPCALRVSGDPSVREWEWSVRDFPVPVVSLTEYIHSIVRPSVSEYLAYLRTRPADSSFSSPYSLFGA